MPTTISRDLTSYPVVNEVGGYTMRGRVEGHAGLVDLSGMVEKNGTYVGRFSYNETGLLIKVSYSVNNDDLNAIEMVIKETIKDIKNETCKSK